jgi:hypothetical protein
MNEAISWRELLDQSHHAGRMGDYAGALRLAQEALAWAKKEFGDASYATAESWQAVAQAADFAGQQTLADEAERSITHLEQTLTQKTSQDAALATQSAIYRADHSDFSEDDGQQAISDLEDALKKLESIQGTNSPAVGYLCLHLGRRQALMGDPASALSNLERAVDVLQQNLGERHVDVAIALAALAGAYHHAASFQLGPGGSNALPDPDQIPAAVRGLWEKSSAAYGKALAIRESHGTKDDARLYDLLMLRANVLRELDCPRDAEALERRANEAMKTTHRA